MEWTTSLKRFAEHLPKDGDKELSLLKCHLLIEELLTVIIERNMMRPEFLQDITGRSQHEWIWSASAALNVARNALAHNLDKKVVDEKLEKFMNCVERVEGPPSADAFNGPMQRFQLSAFKVFMHTLHTAQLDPSDIKIKIILGDSAA
jgi:hypothetical protein